MASAWGASFGAAWGNAWGRRNVVDPTDLAPAAPAVIGGGGSWDDPDLVRRLVDEKWDAIEAARTEGTPKPPARPIEGTPKPLAEPATQAITQAITQAAPGVDTAAAVLLPSAADAARLARDQDDEEALILMLLAL